MKSQKPFQRVLVAAVLGATAATADVSAAVNNRGDSLPESVNIAVNPEDAMISHLRNVEALLDTGAVAGARSVLTASRDFARELQSLKIEADRAYDHIIEANMPESSSVGVLSGDWVGLYGSLDELQAYAPQLAEKTRERLEQAERHAAWGDIRGTGLALEQVAAEVPSRLQPGQEIDRQILLSLELLGENKPDIAAARRVVEQTLNGLTAIGNAQTAAARHMDQVHGRWTV